jgi:hypothetical protein
VVRTADGSIISSPSVDAVVHGADPVEGGDQAVRDACDKVVNDVIASCAFGMVRADPSKDVIMTIEGLGGTDRLDAMVRAIKGYPSVRGVQTVYASERTARLRVDYTGPIAPFVDRLTATRFPGFSVQPQTVVDRDMIVSVVK